MARGCETHVVHKAPIGHLIMNDKLMHDRYEGVGVVPHFYPKLKHSTAP